MSWDISQFHFIRPLILLAIPVLFGLWLILGRLVQTTQWESHISPRMLEAMRINTNKQSLFWRRALLFGWIISTVALAGPTWQKQAVPSFQNQNAVVLVFDLSLSMLAEDLTPNRLTQARYKLIDILRKRSDGQTALIAYAGDAHTVSPLTDDSSSIEALLPALHPSIMPSKGSNTEAALSLAQQLLDDTGISSGEILLITDGVARSAQNNITNNFNSRHRLSILSVGSKEATPIPLDEGGFLRNKAGEIVMTIPNEKELNSLAEDNGGRYSPMHSTERDINYLLNDSYAGKLTDDTSSISNSNTDYDSWQDMGHWLSLLLLPLAALCFRKGVLYTIPLFLLVTPPKSDAFEWKDLWQTQDQQAQQIINENPKAAAQQFKREDWSGVAHYQAEDYNAAIKSFSASNDATSHYNRGNALALNGDLEGSIKAYQQALELQSDYADAEHNKGIIEQILESVRILSEM